MNSICIIVGLIIIKISLAWYFAGKIETWIIKYKKHLKQK